MTEDNDLNDPEDAYDAGDSIRERLRNFVRRIDWLNDHPAISIVAARERIERLREDLQKMVEDIG